MATSDHPRTAVRDAVLATVSDALDADAIEAVEDVSLTSTEAACRSRHHLLDWDEYRAVAL